jgi:hypothetical protein
MTKPKVKTHNEWFQSSCYGRCDCGSNKRSRAKAGLDPIVYIWGEYHIGKWRSVQRICQGCFQSAVVPRLVSHAHGCGCTFQLCPRSGHLIPSWITMPDTCKAA